jgi:branched-chain amino acid transport system permease protein
MDLSALSDCLTSTSCALTQLSTGVLLGMLLFLVAAGLSLIFGVLGIVNFAHGAFYMLGAYMAYTVYGATESFTAALLAGTIGMAIFGVLFERFFISRIYGRDVLMQLLLCYAFVLILDDGVKIIWGGEYKLMGMPAAFARPPFFVGGAAFPAYYVFLIIVSSLVGLILWLGVTYTMFGKKVRAAAINPEMVSSLGINTKFLFAAVFAIGSSLTGLAGALAAPIRTLTPGMGLSILIESFIVTVIGGMGSIFGAFAAAILIGLTRSFGSLGFPLFVDGAMFMMMALVLILKPSGLFGRRS